MAAGQYSSRDVVALAVMTNRMEGVVRKMTQHALSHGALDAAEHRARLLLLRRDLRATSCS